MSVRETFSGGVSGGCGEIGANVPTEVLRCGAKCFQFGSEAERPQFTATLIELGAAMVEGGKH